MKLILFVFVDSKSTHLSEVLRMDVSLCTGSNSDFSTTWDSRRWCCPRRRTNRACTPSYPGIRRVRTGFDHVCSCCCCWRCCCRHCAVPRLRSARGDRAAGKCAPPVAARSKSGFSCAPTMTALRPPPCIWPAGTSGRFSPPRRRRGARLSRSRRPSPTTRTALIVDTRWTRRAPANRFRRPPPTRRRRAAALIAAASSHSKSNMNSRRPTAPPSVSWRRPEKRGDGRVRASSRPGLRTPRSSAISERAKGDGCWFRIYYARTELSIRKSFSKGAHRRSYTYILYRHLRLRRIAKFTFSGGLRSPISKSSTRNSSYENRIYDYEKPNPHAEISETIIQIFKWEKFFQNTIYLFHQVDRYPGESVICKKEISATKNFQK